MTVAIADSVSVISTASNTVVATVPLGGSPWQVAITPNEALAYVTVPVAHSVRVISMATNTVVGSVEEGVGEYPYGIAFTPDGAFAYVPLVGDPGLPALSVINTASNTVVANVPAIAPGGFEVSISPPIMGPETPITVPISTPVTTRIITPTTPVISTPKPKLKALSAALAFSLPSGKQCASRRHFAVHVRRYPGVTWIGAVIKINHKRIRTLGRAHITALVDLRGLPKGILPFRSLRRRATAVK